MHHQRQTAKRTANATDSIIDGKSKGMELTSSHQLVKPQFKQMIMIFAKKKRQQQQQQDIVHEYLYSLYNWISY